MPKLKPITHKLTPLIQAGDQRVRFGAIPGEPPKVACRVLAEEQFQRAVEAEALLLSVYRSRVLVGTPLGDKLRKHMEQVQG